MYTFFSFRLSFSVFLDFFVILYPLQTIFIPLLIPCVHNRIEGENSKGNINVNTAFSDFLTHTKVFFCMIIFYLLLFIFSSICSFFKKHIAANILKFLNFFLFKTKYLLKILILFSKDRGQ